MKLWLFCCSLFVSNVFAEDWRHFLQQLHSPLQDRQSVLNEWLNDEAPHATVVGWPIKEGRFMAIAQGSHLWSDRVNQADAQWQQRHQHPDAQWTDVVVEGRVNNTFRYFMNANVTAETVTLDEAYVNLPLPHLMQVKLGQFYSGFGRLNSQHPHDRDFIDAPIIYKRLFGDSALLEKGVQVNAVLTDGLVIGLEGLTMQNRDQFQQDKASLEAKGAFARWGNAWSDRLLSLLGASWLQGEMLSSADHRLSTQWLGVDMTVKYLLSADRYWLWQAEWLQRQSLLSGVDGLDQSGYYAMLLYRWHPQWRVGLRGEQAYSADAASLPAQQKTSLLLEYDPNQWLRTRWQVGHVSQDNHLDGFYVLVGWQASIAWQ